MLRLLFFTASVISCAAFLPNESRASDWRICNRTAEPMWAAIAFDSGGGKYVSQGWWKLAACGGCASVGSFNLRGVWYRAHNQNSTRLIEGNDLFCTAQSAFRIDTQQACHMPGEHSLSAEGFRPVTLSAKTFTSNIDGSADSGAVCFDQ